MIIIIIAQKKKQKTTESDTNKLINPASKEPETYLSLTNKQQQLQKHKQQIQDYLEKLKKENYGTTIYIYLPCIRLFTILLSYIYIHSCIERKIDVDLMKTDSLEKYMASNNLTVSVIKAFPLYFRYWE